MDDEEQSHSTAPSSMSNRCQDLETQNKTLHECDVLLLFIVFIGRVRISIYMSFFPPVNSGVVYVIRRYTPYTH